MVTMLGNIQTGARVLMMGAVASAIAPGPGIALVPVVAAAIGAYKFGAKITDAAALVGAGLLGIASEIDLPGAAKTTFMAAFILLLGEVASAGLHRNNLCQVEALITQVLPAGVGIGIMPIALKMINSTTNSN